jgi:hypothetical protein
MVRTWTAVDRLLWAVALTCTLLVLALHKLTFTLPHDQASTLLTLLAVLGRRLTVGKLTAAIGLDYMRHHHA